MEPAAASSSTAKESAAEAATSPADAGELALKLVLLHSSITGSLSSVCRLLQVSRACAATTLKHCAGQLELQLGTTGSASLSQVAPWIARYGAYTIGSLNVKIWSCATATPVEEAATLLADALQQAVVAAPDLPGLQLRSLTVNGAGGVSLLQQLPPAQLTYLDLDLASGNPAAEVAAAELAAAAVSALTGLQELCFQGPVDAFLPALNAPSSLTSLQLPFVDDIPALQQLPSQLKQLTGEVWDPDTMGGLRLGHLTQLTMLVVHEQLLLSSGDVLPASLEHVGAWDVCELEVLRPLSNLRVLELHGTSAIAAELQQLSQLTGLTTLSISYESWSYAEGAAAAWRLLPVLESLTICCDEEPAEDPDAIMQHLSKATSLTYLSLEAPTRHWSKLATDIAMALRPLQRLAQLVLDADPPALPGVFEHDGQYLAYDDDDDYYDDYDYDDDDYYNDYDADSEGDGVAGAMPLALPRPAVTAAAANPAGMATLAASLAALPALTEVSLYDLPWGGAEGLQPLKAATQLTQLHVSGNLDAVALQAICCSLSRLHNLKLSNCAAVDDRLLGVIAQQLKHLTLLDISGCEAVTAAGLQQLSLLLRLKQLVFDRSSVARADVAASLALLGL